MKEMVKEYLVREFGDESLAQEVYAEYRSSTEPKIVESAQALAARDFVQLDRTAHALKGNALMIGDTEALDAALALRDAAKAQDASAGEAALARVRAVYDAD